MKLAIGSDHAGFELKEILRKFLSDLGHELVDVGAYDEKPSDYPDFSKKVGDAVKDKKVDRGIMLCGSGVGASVAANKIKGIRASVCHDTYSAHQGVEHDDLNVIVIGARVIGSALAMDIAKTFVSASFSNEERHLRRLQKIIALEQC